MVTFSFPFIRTLVTCRCCCSWWCLLWSTFAWLIRYYSSGLSIDLSNCITWKECKCHKWCNSRTTTAKCHNISIKVRTNHTWMTVKRKDNELSQVAVGWKTVSMLIKDKEGKLVVTDGGKQEQLHIQWDGDDGCHKFVPEWVRIVKKAFQSILMPMLMLCYLFVAPAVNCI